MSVHESDLSPEAQAVPKRQLRRATVAVSGGATVLLGVALLPLPGPGTVVILAGLAVLRREFPVAGKAADGIKSVASKAVAAAGRKRAPTRANRPPQTVDPAP
ncbi:MAG: PGPGW domain-containing protein [Acidimicrobiia bacterium]